MHEWEQLDQGAGICVNCGATDPSAECTKPKPKQSDTLRREIDRLARQMGRMQSELQNLKALV